jgi:hypothetical protein
MTIDEFRGRVASLDGKTLFTATRHRPFTIAVNAEGIVITPSSGKMRVVSWTLIASILERFRAQGSFTPVHYHDLTFDSSYVMAILRHLKSPEGERAASSGDTSANERARSGAAENEDTNSSRSRVAPVFDCLHGVDPSGVSWLHRLLRLGSREDREPVAIRPAALVQDHGRRWGDRETSLPAPRALLEYLVENVDPELVEASGDEGQVLDKRRLLARRDPEAIALALESLRSLQQTGKRPGKVWFALESPSRPDALLETEKLVLCVEGKRTEDRCTTKTKFMACRSQLVRHMDAAMEAYPNKRVLGLLIVEGLGGREAVTPSAFWQAQCRAQYADAMLRESLPHRTPEQRQAIGDGIIGVTTWQAVCAEFRIPWPPAP